MTLFSLEEQSSDALVATVWLFRIYVCGIVLFFVGMLLFFIYSLWLLRHEPKPIRGAGPARHGAGEQAAD